MFIEYYLANIHRAFIKIEYRLDTETCLINTEKLKAFSFNHLTTLVLN